MIVIYWILSLIVISYLFLKTRNFDFLSLAAIFFFYYNYPAYIGISNYSPSGYMSPVNVYTYFVLIIISLMILVFLIIIDNKPRKEIKALTTDSICRLIYLGLILTVISYFSFFLNLLLIDTSKLLLGYKMSINHTFLYGFSIWSSLILFNIGLVLKKKSFLTLSSLIILFSAYAGSRAYITIAIITVFVIILREKKFKLVHFKKIIFWGVAFAFSLTIYKEIYRYIMRLDFKGAAAVLTDINTYQNISILSESIAIFSNLNIVIENNYRLPSSDILDRIASIIPFFREGINFLYGRPVFGNPRFASVVSEELHSTVHWGMGSNIWGEMYALGGILGVVLFSLIWLLFLFLGKKLLYENIEQFVFFSPVLIYWSFYIHRLDFSLAIGAIKVAFFLLLVTYAIFYIFINPYRRKKVSPYTSARIGSYKTVKTLTISR